MNAEAISELLDSAEADLDFVSRSMLGADATMLEAAQIVLERLVESVHRAKAAIPSSAHLWPQLIRERLRGFHVKLRGLRILGNAAMSTVALRSQRPGLSSGEYSARGRTLAPIHVATIALDY